MSKSDDETLLALVEQTVDVMRSALADATADDEAGLVRMEMRALGFLARHDGATAGDLVKRSGRDKGQIARIVAQLIERGLVVREAGVDRRTHALRLTAEGRAVQRRLERRRSRAAAAVFGRFSATEREQLAALLGRIVRPDEE
ncbi:MAG TPA: helix-turn-helix domain-containing protein [Polyangiaceae bacterium]